MFADMSTKYIYSKLKSGKTLINYAFLKISSQGFLFLLSLILAKVLSPDRFGAYSLSLMIIYFFSALFMRSSQDPSIVLGTDELKQHSKINKIFTIRIIMLIQAIILFYLITRVFFQPLSNFSSLDETGVLFLFFAYTGLCIRSFFEGTFLALNHRMVEAAYDAITNIISFIWLFVIYHFFTINIENIFIMFFISPLIASLILIRKIDLKKILPLKFDPVIFRQMFDYTKWTILGSVSLYFVNWVDTFVLRIFVSLDQIGIYYLGYQIFKGILILISIARVYYLPFISEHIKDEKKMKNYLTNKRWIMMAAGFIGICLIYIVLPSLFNILYSDAYQGSVTVARILLVGAVFSLYQTFYSPIFDAMRRYEFTQLASILMVAINLALDYILVSLYGFLGAAVATAITYAILSLIYEMYFRKNLKNIIFPSPLSIR
jgi:O-antigen/teichoic acid export membrane protein